MKKWVDDNDAFLIRLVLESKFRSHRSYTTVVNDRIKRRKSKNETVQEKKIENSAPVREGVEATGGNAVSIMGLVVLM